MISQEEIGRLHEAGLRILEQTGVVFHHEAVADLFRARGYRVDGFRVRMTPDQVMAALEGVPSAFTLLARNPERNLVFGGEALVVGTAAAPAYTVEAGRMRPATSDDLVASVKLAQMARNVDLVGFPVEPQDVSPAQRYARAVQVALTLSDKPMEYALSSRDNVRVALDTSEILYGPSWADELRAFSIVNSVSPLQFDEDACHAVLEMAGRGQPVCVASCVMGGTTGPITTAGFLAVQHAELLAGLVLVQLVRPGSPCLYGGVSSLASMVSGDVLFGVPEYWAAMSATVQLARYLGLPCRAGGGVTDAHVPDMQAGVESVMGMALVIQAGVNLILHGTGIISSHNALSLEKFVVDDETIGMLRSLHRGFPIDDEALAVEVVDRVGPGGNFLSEEHTALHCHEGTRSVLFNRRNYSAWEARGGHDISVEAGRRVTAQLAAYEPPELETNTARRLEEYVLAAGAAR